MAKWLKISLIVFTVLILTIIALPFIFKGKIVEIIKVQINNQLNAQVDFTDYDLGIIRSFPDFKLQLTELSVVGKEEFEGVKLAQIKQVDLVIDIFSVFKGDTYLIKSLILDQPDINLLVTSEGIPNYMILKEDEQIVDTVAVDTEVKLTKLKSYEIKRGNIIYEDKSMNLTANLIGFDHTGSGDFGSSVFNLFTISHIDSLDITMDDVRYMKRVKTDADITLEIDTDAMRFTFKENNLKLNELEIAFDGFLEMPEDDIKMDITFAAQKTSFRSVLSMIPVLYSQNFDQIQSSGQVEIAGYVKGIYSDSKKLMPGFEFLFNIEDAWFKLPDQPISMDKVYFDMIVKSEGKDDYDDMQIRIQKGSFQIENQPVNFHFNMSHPFSDPSIDMALNGKLNLSNIGRIITLQPGEKYEGAIDADIYFLGRLSAVDQKKYDQVKAGGEAIIAGLKYKSLDLKEVLEIPNMTVKVNPDKIDLGQFIVNYGTSDMDIKGFLSNYLNYFFKDDEINGTFNLKSNYLNLNALKKEFASEQASDQNSESEGVIPIPANVDIKLYGLVNTLVYDDLDIKNVQGNVRIKDRAASLENLSMDMMGGKLALNGTYSTLDLTKPEFDFKLGITNWDIQQSAITFNTIEKLAPIAKRSTGRFSTNLSFKGLLNQDMSPILTSLAGIGNLFTKSVFIEGFEPLNELAAKLNIHRLAKQTIEDLSVYFKIEDGRFNVEPYKVKLGSSSATIAGFTALNQEMFFKINMDIPRSEFGADANKWIDDLQSKALKAGIKTNALQKVLLDITAEGTITSPRFSIKWSDQANPLQSLKEELENQLKLKIDEGKKIAEDKVQEIKKDVEDKIQDKKKEAQEELNKRADQVLAEAERQTQRVRDEAKKLADNIRKEGENNAAKLEKEATNPLQKAGAKLAADRLRKEAETRATQIESEANSRADQIMKEARERADSIRRGEENG